MSRAFWCDYGNHAAKHTPETITMQQQKQQKVIGYDAAGRAIVEEVQQVDICKECGVIAGIITDYDAGESPVKRHKSITAAAKGSK